MHLRLFAAALVAALAAAAPLSAALPPADAGLDRPAHETYSLLPPGAEVDACDAETGCTLSAEDEAMLAATLLVDRLGRGAAAFAEERARRFEAESEPDLARLWRDIAAFAAALAVAPAGGP